ncbi:MAG: hypothetical protein CMA34_04030 [Euryarchaeota archaeon]|nr:hypothetical protein [Euryarchaeota archaeon]
MSKYLFSKIRGLIFASGLFCILFILHIVFASFDLWLLFKIVAITLFFSSHFHSLIAFYFSKLESKKEYIYLVNISTIFSIIYSIGYWYAVNDMLFEIWIFFMGLIPFFISVLIIRYLITDN